jgi:hypothetical protein
MASAAPFAHLEQVRTRPSSPVAVTMTGFIVWIAGALYCSGYERLLSGIDNWPGSLVWSAIAVLPWLAFFEWSKSRAGRKLAAGAVPLGVMLLGVAAGSLILGQIIHADSAALPLAALRRLPPIGACLLLVLWSRAGSERPRPVVEAGAALPSLASAIDWIEAADNYIELHIAGRVQLRRMTMARADRVLRRHGFVRIHRRYLVNRRRIATIGDKFVRLEGGHELPVGTAFANNLRTD